MKDPRNEREARFALERVRIEDGKIHSGKKRMGHAEFHKRRARKEDKTDEFVGVILLLSFAAVVVAALVGV